MVPTSIAHRQSIEANRRTYRSVVLHQLIAAEQAMQSAGARSGESAGMYIPSDVDRDVFVRVAAVVEDMRVDAITRHRYPGSRHDLDAVLATALDLQPDERATTRSERVICGLRHRSLGAPSASVRSQVDKSEHELMNAVLSHASAVDDYRAGAKDTVGATIRICQLLQAAGGVPGNELVLVADEAAETLAADGDEMIGTSLDSAGTPTEVEPADDLVGGQPAVDSVDQIAKFLERRSQEQTGGLSLPGLSLTAARSGEVRTFVYDEWDYRARTHRPAWCRVVEEQLDGDDLSFIGEVRDRHRTLRSDIRRRFLRMRPRELVRVHRCDEGEELDIDAVLEAMADHLSGAPADDRLHVRRDRAARDVATGFLVDLSASTSSPVITPEPVQFAEPDPFDDVISYAPIWEPAPDAEPVRRVIDVAKDSVALMSDALGELGDRHAIYGFSGSGRDNVEFRIAKDFSDRVSAASWAALSAMKPLHYTRMGAAIRHATSKLAAEQARTRLLIVISDGYPQDTDYGDDRRDRDYGIHDTARALSDAGERGIDTFCLTIDPAGHDYLRRMCPDRRYLVIDDVESLPAELAKVYLAMSSR